MQSLPDLLKQEIHGLDGGTIQKRWGQDMSTDIECQVNVL